jgi:hypothetical protein
MMAAVTVAMLLLKKRGSAGKTRTDIFGDRCISPSV